MGNITINNDNNQEENQKTTPVLGSFNESLGSSNSLPSSIFQIWLGMRDSNPRSRDQNPLPYRLANPQCLVSLLSISDAIILLFRQFPNSIEIIPQREQAG